MTNLIRTCGLLTPVVSISGCLGQWDPFANATIGEDPNTLLIGISSVLAKAAKVWTSSIIHLRNVSRETFTPSFSSRASAANVGAKSA